MKRARGDLSRASRFLARDPARPPPCRFRPRRRCGGPACLGDGSGRFAFDRPATGRHRPTRRFTTRRSGAAQLAVCGLNRLQGNDQRLMGRVQGAVANELASLAGKRGCPAPDMRNRRTIGHDCSGQRCSQTRNNLAAASFPLLRLIRGDRDGRRGSVARDRAARAACRAPGDGARSGRRARGRASPCRRCCRRARRRRR